MVAQLRETDGGVEPEIDLFARHVDSDQNIEINRLAGLLAQVGEHQASAGERTDSAPSHFEIARHVVA